jgi:uncharacterized membrane protein
LSLGIGLVEVAAPGTITQLIGLGDDDRTRNRGRFYGAGGIATGAAILRSVGALSLGRDERRPAGFGRPRQDAAIRVSKTFTINQSPDEVYAFWRQLDNLPKFMRHLESVEVMGDRTSHWVARGPAGMRVHWDAQMIEDSPQRISWRSLERADVRNSGSVEFRRAPGDRGTELRVRLEYEPPGGRAGKWFARLFGEEPEQQLYEDLKRVKSLLETGEVARSEGSSSVFQAAQPIDGGRATGGRR